MLGMRSALYSSFPMWTQPPAHTNNWTWKKKFSLCALHHRSAVHYMTRTIAVSRNSSLKQSIATQLTMQLQGCAQLHRTSQRSLAYTIRGHTICPVQLCQPQLPSRLADHPVHPGKLTNHIYVGIIAAMEMQHATVLKDANTSKKNSTTSCA